VVGRSFSPSSVAISEVRSVLIGRAVTPDEHAHRQLVPGPHRGRCRDSTLQPADPNYTACLYRVS